MAKYTFEIKPSKSVEGYFVHQCERNLFYNGLPKRERDDFELKDPSGSGSAIPALAGIAWEEQVITDYIIPKYKLYTRTETVDGKTVYHQLSPDETIKDLILMEESVSKGHLTEYLYQACLLATDDIRDNWFNFDKSLYDGTDTNLQVDFTRTYPDLIRADWSDEENCVVFSVIDIKNAKRMKLSHKVQVTLYVRLLKGAIDAYNMSQPDSEKIKAVVNDTEGYLWNGDQEQERPFALKETQYLLEDYFDTVIPAVVCKIQSGIANGSTMSIKDNLDRCVGPQCEWCENCHQCLTELKNVGSTSVMPYLTKYAQEFANAAEAPQTVADLKTFVDDEDNRELLACNRSWDIILNDGATIEVQVESAPYDWNTIRSTAYKWKNRKSLTMPKWQDVSVMLTAQKYAGNGRVYAIGAYVRQREENKNNDSGVVFIAKDQSEKEYLANISSFVKSIHKYLTQVRDYNLNAAYDRRFKLQGYVMDSYELINLEEVLYDVLESSLDMDTKEKTMELLFWMQGERLVSDSSAQPESEAEFPIIVLNSEIRKLISLPVAVAYRLPEILAAMNVYIDEDKLIMADERREFFEYISNVMKSDTIHSYWNEEDEDEKKKIKEHISDHINKRLFAQTQILVKMQGQGRDNGHLVRNLSPFVMSGSVDYDKEILRKWYFEMKLENLLAYHQMRGKRLQGIDIAATTGDAFKITIDNVVIRQKDDGYNEITVTLRKDNIADEVFRDEWFSAIMAEEADADELYLFDDYRCSKTWPKWNTYNKDKISIVNFMEYKWSGGSLYIMGKIAGKLYRPEDAGKTVYLVPRYTDNNSEKVLGELTRLDMEEDAGLLDPATLSKTAESDREKIWDKLISYSKPDGHGFTESQTEAFIHLYDNCLTVLQGPPGTGKTDFIARAVITLCRYYNKEANRQLRVLVSANSHAAIENVLFAIDRKMGDDDDISLYKAARFDVNKDIKMIGKVRIVEDPNDDSSGFVGTVMQNDHDRPVVLGATNWACAKLRPDIENAAMPFDLVVIDEASQVKIYEAMIALDMGDTDSSRFLLVGDGDQLPAIIQGQYGRDSENRYIYGSVFDYYKEQITTDLMLCDNFRMNEILLRYSAEQIYGSRYSSFNEDIASRRLKYKAGAGSHGDIVDYIMDGYTDSAQEYWPLIFCRISGATPFEQNNAEVMLTSRITEAVRDNVEYAPNEDKMLWQGNGEKDGVIGIVSPHHRHIEKLKDKISTDTGMNRDILYIGTVDKLQGQQREAVIVSYGVTDIESAVTEGEFIFNRNRLNVALTRAKCKSITIFSDVLTKASPGMLDTEDEDLQLGIEYVCGLWSFMERSEDDTEIDHKQFALTETGCGGVVVDVYRKRIRS